LAGGLAREVRPAAQNTSTREYDSVAAARIVVGIGDLPRNVDARQSAWTHR
jgi:hypothetical protein